MPWRVLFVRVAPYGDCSLTASLYSSMGKLPVLPYLTQLGRKAYMCYLKPLGVFTR